jgi:hypothetical protein
MAWNAYRGWAKRARDLQADAGRWNLAALGCIVLAAVCGAATSLTPAAPSPWNVVGTVLASGPPPSRAPGSSRPPCPNRGFPCRYAAKAGAYAVVEPEAAKAFQDRVAALEKLATDKSLVRGDDPVPAAGDKREPTAGMTKDWYRTVRIEEQIDYYRKGRAENERITGRLWRVAFVSGLAAVALGALGAWARVFAPWIGAMTTVAASIAAYGLIDRRKYLISSYAAMQASLERIEALDETIPASLADLVTATEDLLDSEHKAWQPQMLAMQHQPPAQPGQQQQQQGQ